MDYSRLLMDMKKKPDEEMYMLARSYGLDFSVEEIRQLRPLLDEVSFHWILTGVPETFVSKVAAVIGEGRTNQILEDYLNMKK